MIHFLASFARCGETMVLRACNAHPLVVAVGEGFGSLPRFHKLRDKYEASAARYVVKQGVWAEPLRPSDVVLVRHPYDAYHSLLAFDDEEGVSGRLRRWMGAIDPTVKLHDDDAYNFGTAYAVRFGPLADGPRVLIYEELVADPSRCFSMLCEWLGVPFHAAMLTAHERYPDGHDLHANNIGSRPIDTASVGEGNALEPKIRARIWAKCGDVAEQFGYTEGGA